MSSSDTEPNAASGLRDPRWLILSHLLPAAAILAFYLNAHRLLSSLLDEETTRLWFTLGWIILLVSGVIAVAMVVLMRTRRSVPWPVAAFSLAAHSILCIFLFFELNELVPWNIPRWMIPRDLFTTTNSLLMIPVVHSLLMLIDRTVSKSAQSWPNFLIAFGLAAFWYLFFLVGNSLYFDRGWKWREYIYVPVMAIATVSFFFFIVRGILTLVRSRADRWSASSLVWRVIVGLGLPLTGLTVHHAMFGSDSFGAPIGSFGHPWFFIIALINGLAICLTPPKQRSLRLLLFFVLACGFTYVLYFAIVFLPWLPLSFPLIIFFGIGFLMMAPTVLLIVQLGDLLRETRWVQSAYGSLVAFGTLLIGLLLIPVCIWLSNASDRRLLHEALAYIHAPDLSKPDDARFNAKDIQRLVERVQTHKRNRNGGFGGERESILTTWYDLQVFEGVTLSEEKTQQLAHVFTGGPAPEGIRWLRSSPDASTTSLKDVHTSSAFEAASGTWRTQVELTITNTDAGQAEYGTFFHLPPGAFITDNWLYIGDRKAQGILADRKAATWIYQQIVTVQRRDPSLLRYITPHELELRVFPFAANETRRCGFEVVTHEPLAITIDGHRAQLGLSGTAVDNTAAPVASADDGLLYVPAHTKATLPTVAVKPALWFLIDRSTGMDSSMAGLTARVDGLLQDSAFHGAELHFMGVNAAPHVLPGDRWREALSEVPCTGGFFAGRAIERIALAHLAQPSPAVPIIILVTDAPDKVMSTDNSVQLAHLAHMPDSWFVLDILNRLTPMDGTATDSAAMKTTPEKALGGRHVLYADAHGAKAILVDDGEPSLVVRMGDRSPTSTAEVHVKDWPAALDMRSLDAAICLQPARELDEAHALVKRSFTSHVLARTTAFICLETEAQEIALHEKQAELMNASSLFDAGDELKPMSEPAEWIALVILAAMLIARWLWKR